MMRRDEGAMSQFALLDWPTPMKIAGIGLALAPSAASAADAPKEHATVSPLQTEFAWPCGGGRKIAKIAMARRLAVQLYWMWRKAWDYEQLKKFSPHAGQPGTGVGVQSNTE